MDRDSNIRPAANFSDKPGESFRFLSTLRGFNMGVPLLQSNPYLRDPVARRAALRVSAASSSAVEGIRKPFADSKPLTVPAPSRKRAKSGAQRG